MFDIDFDRVLTLLQYNEKDPPLFNSGFFLVFFFMFLFFYQFVYKRKLLRVVYFILFSLYFFYKASGWFFLLIIAAAVIDYNISQWIYKSPTQRRKKALLVLSVIINLGVLFWFKCTNFFLYIYSDISNHEIQPLHL